MYATYARDLEGHESELKSSPKKKSVVAIICIIVLDTILNLFFDFLSKSIGMKSAYQ